MSWTDERIDELRRLWAEGLSASQIAGRLGGVTRNAVIGKIHRLGLSGRVKATPRAATRGGGQAAARPKAATPRVMAVGSTVVKIAEATLPAPRAAPIAEVVPLHDAVPFLDLKACHCRWPVGDPASDAFGFCGRKTEAGQTYCEAHAQAAYPARRKKAAS